MQAARGSLERKPMLLAKRTSEVIPLLRVRATRARSRPALGMLHDLSPLSTSTTSQTSSPQSRLTKMLYSPCEFVTPSIVYVILLVTLFLHSTLTLDPVRHTTIIVNPTVN